MGAIIKKNQTDFRVSDQQIVDNHFVGFGAKSAIYSGPERYPGHAFVAFGNGDPLTCSENGEYETWGFYGVANPDYLYFLKNVQGIFVRDDISDPDLFFFVNADFDDYIKALMVKDSFFQ